MKLQKTGWTLLLTVHVALLGGCGDNTAKAPVANEGAPKLAAPSPASADIRGSVLIITYKISGLNRGGEIRVSDNGTVEVHQWGNMPAVQQGQSSMSESYTLPPDRISSLIDQFKEAEFFELDDRYVENDPPGVINEYDWRTITFSENGRTKSITLRGASQVPLPLAELLQEVEDLWRKPGQ